MSQFLIHANEHENFMQVEGHKGWWPRDENKRKDSHPENNPPLDISLSTLSCEEISTKPRFEAFWPPEHALSTTFRNSCVQVPMSASD